MLAAIIILGLISLLVATEADASALHAEHAQDDPARPTPGRQSPPDGGDKRERLAA
jgi:hypothetical protein